MKFVCQVQNGEWILNSPSLAKIQPHEVLGPSRVVDLQSFDQTEHFKKRVSNSRDEESRTLVLEREGPFLAANLGLDECQRGLLLGESAGVEITSTADVRTMPGELVIPEQSLGLMVRSIPTISPSEQTFNRHWTVHPR